MSEVAHLPPLLRRVQADFKLDWFGIHGIKHWHRVWRNGLRLATKTNADCEVIRLFAFLHDSCRDDEHADPLHGARGAAYAMELRLAGLFRLDPVRMSLLTFAIQHHSTGLTFADPTVQTCWDADRLDLGRVGILPDPKHLCTPAAKDPSMIRWAYGQSRLPKR